MGGYPPLISEEYRYKKIRKRSQRIDNRSRSNQITEKGPKSDDCLSKFDWHDLSPILWPYCYS